MPTNPLTLTDSRRLTGPNLIWERAGAVLDVALAEPLAERAVAAWRAQVRRMLNAVGWEDEELRVRRFPGGASLAISAPLDTLFAATEVNEWALAAAEAELSGLPAPDLAEGAAHLSGLIAAERKPRLIALAAAAREHRVTFMIDIHEASIGSGTGSRTWPIGELPTADTIDWTTIHDVPTVLVTGSNGKTTSVRLLAGVLTSQGRVAGMSCTDSVTVGGELVSRGDWAGPGGARMVLRDRRVEVAVLETARGGILRRGLAVERADAAIVTNVAEDHFGEFGIHDLHALAEAKLVVRRAIGPHGRLVLNADDPVLVASAALVETPICWFTLDAANPMVCAHLERGGEAALLEDASVVLAHGCRRDVVAPVEAIPLTLGGAARHNVANALGVAALAAGLGLTPREIASGLARFHGGADENPGRLNLFRFGGITAIVDFAHNPHGMDALMVLARSLPAQRRLVLLGQAGDRDDAALGDFARSAWALRPDHIVLKEMEKYRRGRPLGEIPGVLRDEFLRQGAAPESIAIADSEYAALRSALAWARPGDLLVLPLHSERERGLELLARLEQGGWTAGDPLPDV